MEPNSPNGSLPHYIKVESSWLVLEFRGHDSIEQYDAEAGYPGAALETADRFHVHRETMGRFDQEMTPVIERITGIKRECDERLTAKRRKASPNPERISPIRERFLSYLLRVDALATEEQKAEVKREALRLSRSLQISTAPAERKAPLEQRFYERADSILSADLETIDSKVSRWQSLVPDFELARDNDGKPIRDNLARLLQRYEAAQWAEED